MGVEGFMVLVRVLLTCVQRTNRINLRRSHQDMALVVMVLAFASHLFMLSYLRVYIPCPM
jgi:hypothetical protein